MNTQLIAQTILQQLGGNKFIAMTGSKNFAYSLDAEQNAYLQMKLTTNKAKCNSLRITLNANDTYTMHFSKKTINLKATAEQDVMKITNEVTHTGIYCDMLQDMFTSVTGLYTRL